MPCRLERLPCEAVSAYPCTCPCKCIAWENDACSTAKPLWNTTVLVSTCFPAKALCMNAEHDARLQTRYGSGLFDFVPKQVRSFQTIRTFCLKKKCSGGRPLAMFQQRVRFHEWRYVSVTSILCIGTKACNGNTCQTIRYLAGGADIKKPHQLVRSWRVVIMTNLLGFDKPSWWDASRDVYATY